MIEIGLKSSQEGLPFLGIGNIQIIFKMSGIVLCSMDMLI